MENIIFRHSSIRSEKARLARVLTGAWERVALVLFILLILLGIGLVLFGIASGWLLIGFSAVPYMIRQWYFGELARLPVAKRPKTIDDMLAGDVLGRLSKAPTPQEIALVIGRVRSGQFFGGRFGLSARFLQDIATHEGMTTTAIWEKAVAIKEKMKSEQITGSILVVALIRCFPQYESILAHVQLDDDDIVQGIEWEYHLNELVARLHRKGRTGGVARDWSFGYIPLLTRFGHNISEQIARNGLLSSNLEAHSEALNQLFSTFAKGGRQNSVLVGGAGVGKTTIVHAFAERLLDAASTLSDDLKFRQVFILDASALIAAAPGRGELEKLVMQVLAEAYGAKNIIICLDNAQLFFEEGVGSVDLTNVLLPILEAGRLRIILTMDEQRYLKIGQRNPGLINALNRVSIAPATREETLKVMQDQLILTEFNQKVTYMHQALEESYRLSERYVHDLSMPGRAVKLMESAAAYVEDGFVTMMSVQKAIEKTMNIKVGVAHAEDERDTLLHLEDLIHKRMINQTRAVSVVSDALRRARAGVRSQDRPIGTFLFLGPTGVGKTELAKALADVYFGGEDRMIRLDLNEFVRPSDVARLIADGGDDPSSLTAQAMKQPFSVVLLDEIEKAHPQVLTTLLQLLDEGILRDVKNREVSFRDAIIIATSNAGADRIREYIERGYELEQFEKQFIDELINTNQFRPEFLNRFDEIVTFRPLSKPELVQVIDLILAGINKTLSLQKISIVVEHEAKLLLVEQGYDPRLGARPMRRIVQRTVENTVAKQMLSGTVAPGSVLTITHDQIRHILDTQQHATAIATGKDGVSLKQ